MEVVNKEKQCVSDSHPAVIALKKAMQASGIPYSEGDFSSSDSGSITSILGDPLMNIYKNKIEDINIKEILQFLQQIGMMVF